MPAHSSSSFYQIYSFSYSDPWARLPAWPTSFSGSIFSDQTLTDTEDLKMKMQAQFS